MEDATVWDAGAPLGMDTAYGQGNLARLLPQSNCDQIRVYLRGGEEAYAAATFPPGSTNYLEVSSDLTIWQSVQTNASPYVWCGNLSMSNPPQAFFRARQER